MYQKVDALEHLLGRTRSSLFYLLVGELVFLGILVAWEILSRSEILPAWSFSRPSQVANELWLLEIKGRDFGGYHYLHEHVLSSMWRIYPWLIVGSLVGYFGAIYLSLFPWLRSVSGLIAIILIGTSATGLFVVFQFFWPGGELPKRLIMFWIAFSFSYSLLFWKMLNFFKEARTGSNKESKDLVDWLASLGISRWHFFKDHLVLLFQEMYWNGLRMGGFICWKLTVFTEGHGGNTKGVGAIINGGLYEAEAPLLFAGILTLFVCTAFTILLIQCAEWLFTRRKKTINQQLC